MDYNPYFAHYENLTQRLQQAKNEESQWRRQINWYDDFDGSNASRTLTQAKNELSKLEKDCQLVETELNSLKAKVEELEIKSRLGFDPRYWLSAERKAAKTHLQLEKHLLGHQQHRWTHLSNEVRQKKEAIDKQATALQRYRTFDRLEAEAAIKALTIQATLLNDELEKIIPPMERVQRELAEPLSELEQLQYRKSLLEQKLAQAERFEQQLSDATNGYERKMIHDECGNTLGESKPAKIIRDNRKELESIDRNIRKLDSRLQSISKRATRIIKALIIDGNNLCYQQRSFIGLAALAVIARRLSEKYQVTIVFDASIRRDLKMGDQAIANHFGSAVKTHIVAPDKKADETLLDAAADDGIYVISNDRFGEYPDKKVVREHRLIRHEILNGRVFVHDLNLSEVFATSGC